MMYKIQNTIEAGKTRTINEIYSPNNNYNIAI